MRFMQRFRQRGYLFARRCRLHVRRWPSDMRSRSASSCMRSGTCDGAGACQLYAAGTVCASSACANGTYTPRSVCDGKGACVTPTSLSCSPYVCQDATTCYSTCSSNSQCATPNTCANPGASGSCGLKALGAPCSDGTQCGSGFCAPEGICCNQACMGQCQYCESGTGACKYTSGAPASPRAAVPAKGQLPAAALAMGSPRVARYTADVTDLRARARLCRFVWRR